MEIQNERYECSKADHSVAIGNIFRGFDVVRKLQNIVRQANLIMYENIFWLTIEVQSVLQDSEKTVLIISLIMG